MTTPIADPAWLAARCGLPGDTTAVNHAAQVAQFLASHGVTAVYQGKRQWTVATTAGTTPTEFFWISASLPAGWLPVSDLDQPVILPGGVTAIGRVTVPVQAFGDGADLQVTLYPDNGSGSPATGSPLSSTTVPAAHILALSAPGSLAAAGPLATAQSNTAFTGPATSVTWTPAAGSVNGPGNFATPVTSGNWTVFIGGFDSTASAPLATVGAVGYLGSLTVSSAAPLPSLPQAAFYMCAAATSDTLIAAGGFNGTTGFSATWTAPWDPATGTLGSWSSQQPLPAASVRGAMATWDEWAYVAAGSTNTTAANGSSAVWYASVVNGQISSWLTAPPLPQPLSLPYMAVVGDWLVVAGGLDTSGSTISATWYAPIGSDGTPGAWQPGPQLPQPVFAFCPNWDLVATDSAVMIISGTTTAPNTATPATQVLAVSPDGPAPAWELQDVPVGGTGAFQTAFFPNGTDGEWDAFTFLASTYQAATVLPVPMISVPLPATGLTPGSTYHVVLHQVGGDTTNNYLQAGEMAGATPPAPWLGSPRGSGGPWSPHANRAVCLEAWDQSATGPLMHLWEDSGARVVSLAWSGAGGRLLGVLESSAFPAGSPEAVLPAVTQVTYGATGLPSGTVELA